MSGETPCHATSRQGTPRPTIGMTERAFRAEVLAMLRTINRRLDALPAQVAGTRAGNGSRLSPSHRAALVNALSRYMNVTPNLDSRVFSARDLLQCPDVAEALGPAVGNLRDAGCAKRVGKLLARGDGEVHGGLFLQHAGNERGGTIWRISKVGA